MLAALLSTFAANYGNAQDWPNLAEFQEVNATLEAPKEGENRVIFMGNSITIGWINSIQI